MTPGARYIVSLGRDEEAQLAVSGSLTLAAARFQRLDPPPAPPSVQDEPDRGSLLPQPPVAFANDLPSPEDAYAAMSWDATLPGRDVPAITDAMMGE